MPATSKLEEIIASKAARGKYLFQTEYAEMPYHLSLTIKQWSAFEGRRDEIKTWLAERGMFCEFVSSKMSKRNASSEGLDLFYAAHPEYSRENFDKLIQEYTQNPNKGIGTLTAYKADRDRAENRFLSDLPSGVHLGFLTENDAMEFRLRWL